MPITRRLCICHPFPDGLLPYGTDDDVVFRNIPTKNLPILMQFKGVEYVSLVCSIVWLHTFMCARVDEEVLPLNPLVQKPVRGLDSYHRFLSLHNWPIARCGFIHALCRNLGVVGLNWSLRCYSVVSAGESAFLCCCGSFVHLAVALCWPGVGAVVSHSSFFWLSERWQVSIGVRLH